MRTLAWKQSFQAFLFHYYPFNLSFLAFFPREINLKIVTTILKIVKDDVKYYA